MVEKLFSRKSGIRHIIMLLLSVVLIIVAHYLLTLLASKSSSNDSSKDIITQMYLHAQSENIMGHFWGLMAGAICVATGLGALLFYQLKKYFLGGILGAFWAFFGWLPFINRLFPESENSLKGKKQKMVKLKKQLKKLPKDSQERQELLTQIRSLQAEIDTAKKNKRMFALEIGGSSEESYTEPSEEEKEYERKKNSVSVAFARLIDESDGFYYGDDYYYGENPGKSNLGCIGIIFSPITLILELGKLLYYFVLLPMFVRILAGVVALLMAFALPVLSPALLIIGAVIVNLLIEAAPAIVQIVVYVWLAAAVAVLIVQPILTLVLGNKAKELKA